MVRKKTQAAAKPKESAETKSTKVMLRISPELRRKLQGLADRHHRGNISAEIKAAIGFWVSHFGSTQLHTSALVTAVAVLANRIERFTGSSWNTDEKTGELVRDCVTRLITHILPEAKSVEIDSDPKEDAELFLKLLIQAVARRSVPRPFAGTVIIDDPALATILRDMGKTLSGESPQIETRPELVDHREQQEKENKL